MEDSTLSTLTAISSIELEAEFGNSTRNNNEEMNPLLDHNANLLAGKTISVFVCPAFFFV